MKQQLSILFADKSVNQIYSALGFYFLDAIAAKKTLGGVHGQSVGIITREEFEAMPDDSAPAKPVLTLEDKLARLDSKGIQEQLEKQGLIVKKKNDALEKLKKQGDRMDANKFHAAKEAFDNELEIFMKIEDALSLRVDEEKAQALLEAQKQEQSTQQPETPETETSQETAAPETEASQEVTQ